MVSTPAEVANTQAVASAAVVLEGITKAYGPTRAVAGMRLVLVPGQVLGVIGPNGAGKSTLMRIIAGETIPDAGSLLYDGRPIDFRRYSPQAAHALGIRFVHQELSLCANLSVVENFLVEFGETIRRPWRANARRRAQQALDATFPGSGIDPDRAVATLTLAQRQMVEIARATAAATLRLLILDEPTSALPHARVDQLRTLLGTLRRQGVMVVFITHRLTEILDLTDQIVVMRNGAATWSGPPAGMSREDLVERMGGKPVVVTEMGAQALAARHRAAPVLAVHDLSHGSLRRIDLHVDAGEIVGLSGLEGSGQRELLRAVFGRGRGGAIQAKGAIVMVSGDRRNEGIFPLWPIAQNLSVSALRQLARWLVIDAGRERAFVASWIGRLALRAEGPGAPITSLSGGNQQKAIIARALGTASTLVLLDDPTRGVDAATKQEVYTLLREAAAHGRGVLWYSTEDQEMLECERVYVMARGAVVAELAGAALTEEHLVAGAFRGQERTQASGAWQADRAPRPIRRVAAPLAGALRMRWLLPLLSFIAMLLILDAHNGGLLGPSDIDLVIGTAVPLVCAALAQMFIILVGDIDLGMGAFVGLVNVIAVTWLYDHLVIGLGAFVLAAPLYALVGFLIHVRRMPAIVVTLGASFVWLGLALTILPTAGGQSPQWLLDAYGLNVPVLTEPVLLVLIAAGIAYWFTMRTRAGTLMRGMGDNAAAIAAAGWSTLIIRLHAYGIAALFAVLAGLTFTAMTTSGDATASSSFTLLSIAAVILGGSEFSGGIVVPIGVVAGALTLSLVGAVLSVLNIDPNYAQAVEGVILLVVLVGRGLTRAR